MHVQCARSHSLCSWTAIAQRLAERGYTLLLHARRNTDRAIACLYRPKDLEFVGRTDSAAALQLTFRLSSAHPAAQSDLLHLLVLDLESHVLLSSCRLVQLDDAMRSLAAAAGEASTATARAPAVVVGELGATVGSAADTLLRQGRLDARWTEAELPQVGG